MDEVSVPLLCSMLHLTFFLQPIFVLPGVITSLCLDTVSARTSVWHFAVAGPTVWNSLSDDLPTLSTEFQSDVCLKLELVFSRPY